MAIWQQEYNSNLEVQELSKNFDKFITIDWPLERLTENRKYYEALKHRSSTRYDEETGNMLRNIHEQETEDREEESTRPLTAATSDANVSITNFSSLTSINSINSLNTAATSAMSTIIQEISNMKLIKSRIWLTVQIWLVLTITGIVIGSIAAFLSGLTEWLNSFKIGYCSNGFFLNEKLCNVNDWKEWSSFAILSFLFYTTLSILFGLFASLLCLYFAPNAAGSGISEVKCIVSGFDRPDFLNINTLLVKAFALPFTIASGLAVGKEGPSVHYASCVSNVIARFVVPWLNESPFQLSDIITAGAGSGVAVAFGSPIGGVLFSIEEISSGIRLSTLWKTFYTSLIAITTLQIWNPFGTGQIVMFEVSYTADWVWSEIIWFVILGIFGGLYGIFISRWNIKYVAFRQRYLSNWKFSGVYEIFWLCLISSIVGYWNIYMRLDMTKVMELLFDSCSNKDNGNPICSNDPDLSTWVWTLFTLFSATIIRMILVCISYGSKVPCGIFVPSMAIGATFGKMLGMLVEEIFGYWVTNDDGSSQLLGVSSGTYAFLGAGAALSGITGLTSTTVVIMYELTGAIKYIVPTMITIVSVRIVIELGGNGYGGIADQMIKFNGIPYIDLKEEHELGEAVNVADIMVPKIIGLDCQGMYERDILKILEFNKREYPLLFKRRCVVGVISHKNLIKILDRLKNDRIIDDIANNNNNNDNSNNSNDSYRQAINLENLFVRFISKKKMMELVSRIVGERIEYEVDDLEDEENGVFEEFVEFEILSINLKTSVYTLFDIFVDIGSRIVFVNDDVNKLVGIVSRKDLIRYENYIHFKQHGNVFVNDDDVKHFRTLWEFYSKVWNIIKFWDRNSNDAISDGNNNSYRLL